MLNHLKLVLSQYLDLEKDISLDVSVQDSTCAYSEKLDYEFDHCQEQDIGADFVKSNYRDGNFERAVVMSVDGEDMPDIALKKKKSQVAQAIINELSVVDPLHPLVMEAEQEMFFLNLLRSLSGHKVCLRR